MKLRVGVRSGCGGEERAGAHEHREEQRAKKKWHFHVLKDRHLSRRSFLSENSPQELRLGDSCSDAPQPQDANAM